MTGAELKAFRVERGWSQAAVAEAIGASENSVSTWERGPRIPRTVAMAVECLRWRAAASPMMETVDALGDAFGFDDDVRVCVTGFNGRDGGQHNDWPHFTWGELRALCRVGRVGR